AFGQGHGAHVDVTLGKAQLVPLTHDVAATHFTELVGGQPAHIAEQLEVGNRATHHAGCQHGIAVDDRNHGAVVRHVPGNRPEAVGQPVALAGPGDAHEAQLDPLGRVELAPEILDQQLVGALDDGADHGSAVVA